MINQDVKKMINRKKIYKMEGMIEIGIKVKIKINIKDRVINKIIKILLMLIQI
jgi:hypothetical protein